MKLQNPNNREYLSSKATKDDAKTAPIWFVIFILSRESLKAQIPNLNVHVGIPMLRTMQPKDYLVLVL